MAALRYVGTRGPGGIWVGGAPIPSDMPIMVTPMNDPEVIHAEDTARRAKAHAKEVRKERKRQRRELRHRELSRTVATATLLQIAADEQSLSPARIAAAELLLKRSGALS